MYKRLLCIAIICVGLVFSVLLFWYKYGLSLGYSCTGNINFHKNSAMLRLTSKLRLNRGEGTLTLNGVVIENDGARQSLNRTIHFNSVNDADHYSWTSIEITPSIDENITDKEVRVWLPGFYTTTGENIELYITRLNYNSITISGDLLPYLICTSKH